LFIDLVDDTETYALNDIARSQKEHWALWSLRHGLSQLTDRLEDVVTNAGVEIRKCTPCQKLEFSDNIVKVDVYDLLQEFKKMKGKFC